MLLYRRADRNIKIRLYCIKTCMENIFKCKKTDTGVTLVRMEGKSEKQEFFSFAELEEMRIKVPDLIENPKLFRIDLQEHKIYLSQAGRGTD